MGLKRLVNRGRDEAGNTSVLTIGVMVVVLMVIAFGAAVTGVEVDRNRLQFVADGAALYASSAFDESQVYGHDPGTLGPAPTDADARARARAYVEKYPIQHPRIRDVTVSSVRVEPDGRVAVTLRARTRPPLVGWIADALDVPVPLTVHSEGHTH